MDSAPPAGRPTRVPNGFRAVPLHLTVTGAPLKLCVMARTTPDAANAPFVLLRDLADARVYLGCVMDGGGKVREWVELWVQDTAGLESTPAARREMLCNHFLDQRWQMYFKACLDLNPEDVIQTGWELVPPPPIFLDVANGAVRHPVDQTIGQSWQLCRDDALLQAAGLPPYSTSLTRCLHIAQEGQPPRFVKVVSTTAAGSLPAPLLEALGPAQSAVPFNPHAGLMMVRSFCPLSGEDFIDLLGGKAWAGCSIGKHTFDPGSEYASLREGSPLQHSDTLLFLGARGRAGRLLEIFHLKLRLILEMFRLVRGHVQAHQLPLLNLSPESFRFKLAGTGAGLPGLWTARGTLVKPSQTIALTVPLARQLYFSKVGQESPAIYQPEGLAVPCRGTGTVRVRKLLSQEKDSFSFEGTLDMGESSRTDHFRVEPNDLLWLRVPLATERLDLYGHVYAGENLAYGEARFHTLPQKLPPDAAAALQASGTIAFRQVAYEVVPLTSSPCDLHSLAVLAVRTLLVDEENSLSLALDEILSLARQVKGDAVKDEQKLATPLGLRIKAIFERDARWLASLGPHRLLREKWESAEAMGLITPELWFDMLAALIVMFPGRGPDSLCRDFGDVPQLALETVFDKPLERWQHLLLRSRSLLFIDWRLNQEVADAIRRQLNS